jgi:hypothetical protein
MRSRSGAALHAAANTNTRVAELPGRHQAPTASPATAWESDDGTDYTSGIDIDFAVMTSARPGRTIACGDFV